MARSHHPEINDNLDGTIGSACKATAARLFRNTGSNSPSVAVAVFVMTPSLVTRTVNRSLRRPGRSRLGRAHNYKPANFLNGSTALESEILGSFESEGCKLIRVLDGDSNYLNDSDLVGTRRNPLDPRLGALANNGGPTLTHALLAGSKAIDAADFDIPQTDQRGRLRPGDGNGTRFADIGTYKN